MYYNCNTFGTMPLSKIKQNCATDQKLNCNTNNETSDCFSRMIRQNIE